MKNDAQKKPEAKEAATDNRKVPTPSLIESHAAEEQKSSTIFSHTLPWKVFALGSSWNSNTPFRFAIGSFVEEQTNFVGQ